MSKNNKKTHVVKREELLKKTSEYARMISEIVGSTMTENGEYISMPDGTTTNDGATIISKLNRAGFWNDDIEEMYLSKLMEATEKTDELAGDGTSATTVVTSTLINTMYKMFVEKGFSKEAILRHLDAAEKRLLQTLNREKKQLKNKQDYINLAMVSTKDKVLGKMIGSAIYRAGVNSLVSIKEAVNRSEDYIEVNSSYIIPIDLTNYGLPEFLTDVKVFAIDSLITDQDEAIRQINRLARKQNINILLIATEVDESAIRFTVAANKENEGRGSLTLASIPKVGKFVSAREIIEDVAAYCGTKVQTKEGFKTNPNKAEEISMGYVSSVNLTQDKGIVLDNKEMSEEKTPLLFNRIKLLQEKISYLNTDTQVRDIAILKGRINALSGNTVTIYIYDRTQSALETKSFRVQDAIKATQYALGFGYIGGAGFLFANQYVDDKCQTERSFRYFTEEIAEEYMVNLYKAMGAEVDLTPELPGACKPYISKDRRELTIIKDGKVVRDDVYKNGIIDSAKVMENVIKNSFSIAKEYAKIGAKVFSEYEE